MNMFPNKILSVLCAFFSLQLLGVIAYPMLNIPFLFGSESRYKKNELGFPVARLADEEVPIDGDVLELEHLKHAQTAADNIDSILESVGADNKKSTEKPGHTIALPELPLGVDAETVVTLPPPTSTTTTTTTTTTTSKAAMATAVETTKQVTGEIIGGGIHRPPTLSQNEQKSGQQQTVLQETGMSAEGSQGVPSGAKPFYGAARLAFGQNPEILPTSSTASTPITSTSSTLLSTSTSSTATSASTSSPVIDTTTNTPATSTTTTTTTTTSTTTTEMPVTSGPIIKEQTETSAAPISTSASVTPISAKDFMQKLSTTVAPKHNERELIGDLEVTELEKVKRAVRRSIQHMTPKTTKNFLHLDDGQLSPFDMAQYIFLTGDEEGVTQAIEECIEDGILSREQALKLLHDIRVGLEYLQGLPEPRVFPEMLHPNSVKKSFQTLVTTTKKPLNLLSFADDKTLHLNKPMDSIALWNKLQELNVDGKQELNDYDEATGRAKIAEFLYTHYTVEEILYKLAKVMFTQSLAHGSDEAQRELQKLTDFLEREGNSGVIPVDLQKKILHVLLTALSDTLTEHPELLAAAQQNLVNPYDRIPMRTYGRLN